MGLKAPYLFLILSHYSPWAGVLEVVLLGPQIQLMPLEIPTKMTHEIEFPIESSVSWLDKHWLRSSS